MIEKIVNVVIKENGFDDVNSKAINLEGNLDNVSHSNKNVASSFAESSNAVLENGGAMGLLNDLTGGYAMMVKDAVEASALFIVKKRADTVATNATTAATISANTATQSGIITKIKDVATTVSSTVAKYATAGATQVVTAAQWLWNAAVMANPLVALVVAIVAAGAAIYKLTSFLMENAAANEAASAATAKMTAELKSQSIAAARSLRALQENADYTYELAKANGASTAELRKMKEAAINAEIALNKKNVTVAQSTFLQERNNLAIAKANDLSDEEIAKKEKLVQAAYKEFQEQNNLLDASYKGRAKLTKSFNIEVATENNNAAEKAKEQRIKDNEDYKKKLAEKAKAAADAAKEAIKAEKDRVKNVNDAYESQLKELEDLNDDTEQEKLDRQKQRDLEAIDNLKATESEKNGLRLLLTEEYFEKQKDLDTKTADEKKVKDEKDAADKKTADEKIAADKIELEQRTSQVIATTKENLNNIVAGLESAGLAKSKAGQAATKALALFQIGVDTAQAFSNAVPMAIKAGKEAAAVAGPAAPVVGPLATGISYASSAAMIVSNIARAKQLLSSASSGGGGSASGGGGSTPAAPPPQFNIVGQSGTNQLAQSIGAQQGQPIQAYVVGNEVTSQQALDRNRITTATFN